MKFKTLVIILASLVIAWVSSAAFAAPPQNTQATLTFLNKYPEQQYKAYFDQAIKDFQAKNPNIKINMESVSDEAIKDKLRVAAGGGDMPDIFFSWSGQFEKNFVNSGLTKDLTPYVNADKAWKDGFIPALLKDSTFGNKVYGIPFRSSLEFMLYNKRLFKESGVDVPKNWNEFLNVCAKLKQNKVIPILFGNSEPWYGAWWIGTLNQLMVNTAVREKDYAPETGEFTDPNYVKALDHFLDLQKKDYFNSNVNSTSYYQVREQFFAGKGAMILDATSQFSIYSDNMKDDWGFFRFPQIPEGNGNQNYITGGTEVYCVSAKTKYPDQAIAFIKFLTSKEQAKKQTKISGLPNCIVNGLDSSNASDVLMNAMNAVNSFENVMDWLDTAVNAKVADKYLANVQDCFNGKTADQAMKEIQQVAAQVKASSGGSN